MQRFLRLACAAHGLLAVGLGAFGAHALRTALLELPDGMRRLEWWGTAADYHLAHALALGLVASFAGWAAERPLWVSGVSFFAGIALFSGSLYVMALTGWRGLGAITPFGGACLLAGWAALAWAAWRSPSR